MSKVYDQLHEAAKSGRSDVIGAAIEDWLDGMSTTEELTAVVSAGTKPTANGPTTGYSSTASVLSTAEASRGA